VNQGCSQESLATLESKVWAPGTGKEFLEDSPGEVEYPHAMVKSGVGSTGVYQITRSQLFNSGKLLKLGSSGNQQESRCKIDMVPNWISQGYSKVVFEVIT